MRENDIGDEFVSNALRTIRRGHPMVAYSADNQPPQARPMDTGVMFDGRVRIWLFTDDPQAASACGRKLEELGLPRTLRLIRTSSVCGCFAINPNVEPRWNPQQRCRVPEFLRYRQWPILLETQETMDIQRFYNWLHANNPNVPPPKQGPPPLTELADAGEIESFDAG